jgi:hypothetical protein
MMKAYDEVLLKRFAVTRESALRFGAWLSALEIPEITYEAVQVVAEIADALEAAPVADPTTDADVADLRRRYLDALLMIVLAGPLHHRVRAQLKLLEGTERSNS